MGCLSFLQRLNIPERALGQGEDRDAEIPSRGVPRSAAGVASAAAAAIESVTRRTSLGMLLV